MCVTRLIDLRLNCELAVRQRAHRLIDIYRVYFRFVSDLFYFRETTIMNDWLSAVMQSRLCNYGHSTSARTTNMYSRMDLTLIRNFTRILPAPPVSGVSGRRLVGTFRIRFKLHQILDIIHLGPPAPTIA